MKKQFLLGSMAVLLIVLTLPFQSFSQYWNTTGNDLVNSTDFLGTKSTSTYKDLIIMTNGTEAMRVKSNGLVGMGITSPLAKLDISTSSSINGLKVTNTFSTGGSPTYAAYLIASSTQNYWVTGAYCSATVGTNASGNIAYGVWATANNTANGALAYAGRFTVATVGGTAGWFSATGTSGIAGNFSDGLVKIGNVTTPTGYKLYVETGILTEKVKVAIKTSGDWVDYVFAPEYKLMSLRDLENFVNQNHHLPDVPSANDVLKNGIDLGQMDATLLKKIEELSLYMIQLQKENDGLKLRVANLEKN